MFTVEKIGPNLYHIKLETEEVVLIVAELSRGRDWELHYRAAATALKPNLHGQLRAFVKEQITQAKITERLLK